MDVSRWAIDLKLAPADRRRLEDLVRSGNTPQKLVPRARIALLSDGTRLNETLSREGVWGMGRRSDDPPDDPRWSEAERLATQLDRILDSTSLKSEARAAAINDLAARLKRTPQTIRNHLRKYGRRRLVRDLLRDDSGRGPRLLSEAETIVRTVLDDKYLTLKSASSRVSAGPCPRRCA
ncbi:hypothetical protein [Azospirillum canadense]|uniref:hypothetical protein n=1 Tax=Azospirillum canadense TaxID=403962 RepID=UPI002226A9E1|nr:hypothetical protein [Azospirillum canadense]MCW2240683.1 DNA-binding transcriptional ArsR family regulator [Azospirillum canadense]